MRGYTTACAICARSYILTARAKGGCDNMTTLNGGNDDKINVGDIVHIDGYGDKEIEIITIERTYYIDANYEYEATEVESLGLHDKRNYYADAADLTVIRRAKPTKHPDHEQISDDIIDDLLDEIRSCKTMLGVYGKDSGKGRDIAKRIDSIKAQLSEAV